MAVAVADAVAAACAHGRPFSGADPAALAASIAAIDPCPEEGVELGELLAQLSRDVLAHGVDVADPYCAAHLHCPTLLPAAAAELAIGATNQSMDSFDQAPAATLVEDHLVRWLADTLGFAGGSGVLTSGGTASNLLGLLLAREPASARVPGHVAGAGLPAQHTGWRIVASRAAHDSVRRSAALLGLGAGAVVGVATDRAGRIDLAALDAELHALGIAGHTPIAIVATAGTTDLGAIDPLAAVAGGRGPAAPGCTSTPRSARRSRCRRGWRRGLTASSRPTRSPPTCTSSGSCRSAPARCSCATSRCSTRSITTATTSTAPTTRPRAC